MLLVVLKGDNPEVGVWMPRSPWAIEPREAVSGSKKRHATRRRVPTDSVRDSYVIMSRCVEQQMGLASRLFEA